MKKIGIKISNLVIGILSILVGLFLVAADAKILATWTFRLVGVIMIVANIGPVIYAIKIRNYLDLILRLILISFGIMFIFYFNSTACVIVGLLFIIMPLIMIGFSKDKKSEFIEKLPTILLGIIILLISPENIVKWFYIVIGIALVIYGGLLVITSIYFQKELNDEQ